MPVRKYDMPTRFSGSKTKNIISSITVIILLIVNIKQHTEQKIGSVYNLKDINLLKVESLSCLFYLSSLSLLHIMDLFYTI